MSRGWIQTSTGKKFFPLAPRVEDLDIRDIARGLAMTCRYGGQTARSYYSVAEHCVLVSRHVAPEFAREGLLHDSAEAYIGDMVRPLKHQPEMSEFRRAETVIERCVAEKYGLRTDTESLRAVKLVDDRILLDEMRALMHTPELYTEPGGWTEGLSPLGAEILGYSPERAEVLFLARFGELFPEFVDSARLSVRLGDLEIL